MSHFTTAIELLQTLPDTPERRQQELGLQVALGAPLTATQSWAAPEVEKVYIRAQELCEQVGETPELFLVLWGLWAFHNVQAEYRKAHELGEQLLRLAQSRQDPALLVEAHYAMGSVLFHLGELAPARTHLEQGNALYDSQQHHSLAFSYGSFDPGVSSLCETTRVLWPLGYPEQALKRSHEALSLAQELSHPFSLAYVLNFAAILHQYRREGQAVQERAEAVIALSTEQGFPYWLALGSMLRGWALAEQGQGAEGISQLHEGLAAFRATGSEVWRPYFLVLLAEMHGKTGQAEEGLRVVEEALAIVERTDGRFYEAELYRIKGQLVLQSRSPQSTVSDPRPPAPDPQVEAEACFLKAIAIAQKQQAKSLELRAVMSLVRLRQQQALEYESRNTDHVTRTTQHETCTRLDEAHRMLSEIYNWFTEGFDTKDLQEAKALLESLSP